MTLRSPGSIYSLFAVWNETTFHTSVGSRVLSPSPRERERDELKEPWATLISSNEPGIEVIYRQFQRGHVGIARILGSVPVRLPILLRLTAHRIMTPEEFARLCNIHDEPKAEPAPAPKPAPAPEPVVELAPTPESAPALPVEPVDPPEEPAIAVVDDDVALSIPYASLQTDPSAHTMATLRTWAAAFTPEIKATSKKAMSEGILHAAQAVGLLE